MNTKQSEEKRYVCFFQSVLTVGIMSRGKTQKDAERKALLSMRDVNGVNYCSFNQTPLEHTSTEQWQPEFEPDFASNALSFKFDPDEKTKNVIATRLGKRVEELTDADLEVFVKESIEMALFNEKKD